MMYHVNIHRYIIRDITSKCDVTQAKLLTIMLQVIGYHNAIISIAIRAETIVFIYIATLDMRRLMFFFQTNGVTIEANICITHERMHHALRIFVTFFQYLHCIDL